MTIEVVLLSIAIGIASALSAGAIAIAIIVWRMDADKSL
jgi:hypothetical protein